MRKIIYFFALLAFGFTSCDKQNAIAEVSSFPNPPEVVKSKLPKFPAEVLYVVGREYETIKDGTSMKAARQKMNGKIANINEMTLNRYVEDRLIELYPEEAYVGIANDMVLKDYKLSTNIRIILTDFLLMSYQLVYMLNLSQSPLLSLL